MRRAIPLSDRRADRLERLAAAIRSDCSDAIERICSGEKPSWSGHRSWNAAEMNVLP